MSIFSKITDFVGGSLFKEIKDGVMSYFPPDMTPQQKAEVEYKMQSLLFDKQREIDSLINEASTQLDKRIAEQEGTASDLKSIPILGNIVLFARGAQRPTWGFMTAYMDLKWFFGNYTFTEQQNTALLVINVLVLGFLFGERAIQNALPVVTKFLQWKRNQ